MARPSGWGTVVKGDDPQGWRPGRRSSSPGRFAACPPHEGREASRDLTEPRSPAAWRGGDRRRGRSGGHGDMAEGDDAAGGDRRGDIVGGAVAGIGGVHRDDRDHRPAGRRAAIVHGRPVALIPPHAPRKPPEKRARVIRPRPAASVTPSKRTAQSAPRPPPLTFILPTLMKRAPAGARLAARPARPARSAPPRPEASRVQLLLHDLSRTRADASHAM